MKILIVVDMQNDFISGPLGTKEALNIVPKVEKKIDEYRANHNPIVFTRDTHGNDYLNTNEGKHLPIEHCIEGTDGWEIHNALQYAGYMFRTVINKPTFGAFNWPMIHDGDEIEIVGLCTDICVVSNALILRSRYPENNISVDASCCAGTTPENHRAALAVMKACQIIINNEQEV